MRTILLALFVLPLLIQTASAASPSAKEVQLRQRFGGNVTTWKGWIAGATNSAPGKVQIANIQNVASLAKPAAKISFSAAGGQFRGSAIVTQGASKMTDFKLFQRQGNNFALVRSEAQLSEKNYEQ